MNEFSEEQLISFLKFTWGRTRLPSKKKYRILLATLRKKFLTELPRPKPPILPGFSLNQTAVSPQPPYMALFITWKLLLLNLQ